MNGQSEKNRQIRAATDAPFSRRSTKIKGIPMLRIALVTNHPPPFRIPIYHKVARTPGVDLQVIFCSPREPNRQWDLPPMQFKHSFYTRSKAFIAASHGRRRLYRSARVFLFPTVHDAWGVVVNEACASGLPVVVSPHAGVVGELAVDGENGFVCELDLDLWIDRVALLLSSDSLYSRFARCSSALVSSYTFDHAAAGIVDACRYAVGNHHPETFNEASRKWG